MSKTGQKKKLTKKQLIIRIAIIVGAALLALAVTAVSIIYAMLGRVQRGSELSGSVGINVDLPTEGVQNIALFGLDTARITMWGVRMRSSSCPSTRCTTRSR